MLRSFKSPLELPNCRFRAKIDAKKTNVKLTLLITFFQLTPIAIATDANWEISSLFMEKPKTLSLEEMAKIEKERALSDAELLKSGAEYKFDDQGRKMFKPTDEQLEEARKGMEKDKSKERMESPKIEFPEDIAVVRALQNKLTEYKERLEKQIKDNPYKAPEVFADTKYKITILEELLTKGEVDGEKLFKKITNTSKEVFNFDAYHEAYKVIEDYAKTGGKEIAGGTGLKFEKKQQKQEREKPENEKDKPEKIFQEIIKNPKMKSVLKKGWEVLVGSDKRMYVPGTVEYERDLKYKSRRFLELFPTKEDFEKRVKEKRQQEKGDEEKIKTGYEHNPKSEYYRSIIEGWKVRDAYEKKHGWEATFGETYDESLKEFSQLLYEGFEKYQREKIRKTEKGISGAKNFEDLDKVIKMSGGIQGSRDFFTPDKLKDFINDVRSGKKETDWITSSLGLRQKVEELLKLEAVRNRISR